MTRSEILHEIHQIFKDTLDNEEVIITEATKAEDVDEWDSLMHVLLVDSMEKQFDIRFKASEIQNWKDIGEIVSSIVGKSNEKIV